MKKIKIPKFKSKSEIPLYLNKLIGHQISESRMLGMYSDPIVGLESMGRRSIEQDVPDSVRYKTVGGMIQLDFLVCVQLIENPSSSAYDCFGFEYKVIELCKRKYNRAFPNNPNPKLTLGSKNYCHKCQERFSYWDDLNLNPLDTETLCATCKGIEIEYVD